MNDETKIVSNAIPELTKGATLFVNQIYQDLAQPTVKVIGGVLKTTFEFATIPVLALSLATDTVKLNFAKRLEEYKTKLEKVPEEKRCAVEPEIGGPIIRNLMNTTNDKIADLFTTLLTNASNIDTLDKAHPKFAQIVQNLTPDEAMIIRYLKDKNFVCYVDFRGEMEKGYIDVMRYTTLIPSQVPLSFPNNINAYIFNFISFGILTDMTGVHKADDTLYDGIIKLYKENLEKEYVPKSFKAISIQKSFLEITDFGKLFIDACIL